MRKLIARQNGQTMVETALVLFLLLLIVIGILEFGRIMYLWNSLNNAARTAVRQAVVTPSVANATGTLNNTCNFSTSDANSPVYKVVCDNLVTGIQDKTTVAVTITGVGTAPMGQKDVLTVTVRWNNLRTLTRLFEGMITNTLTASATMQYEL